MNRLNSLLRASLESGTHEGSSVGPSLEDYMEYRAALEEYEEAVGIQDKLSDLSSNLTDIATVVDESAATGSLTDDQVELQVAMVNNVRTIVDGDVAEISIESFTSIEAASMEASSQSDGLLKRMWEGFLAMLRKIRDAFKKMWAWIFGTSKRAETVVKELDTVTKTMAGATAPMGGENVVVAAKQLQSAGELVKASLPETNKQMAEIEKSVKQLAIGGNSIITSSEGDAAISKLIEELGQYAKLSSDALVTIDGGNDAVDVMLSNRNGATGPGRTPAEITRELSGLLTGFSVDSRQVTKIVEHMDTIIRLIEVTGEALSKRDGMSPELIEQFRNMFTTAEKHRQFYIDYLKVGDRVVTVASGMANKMQRNHRMLASSKLASQM